MSASIYDDKMIEPDEKMLTFDLAQTKSYLDQISQFIENKYGNFKTEWKFYNQKSGWVLKMLSGKRTILFMVPCNNYFRVAFTFGDKAADLVFESPLDNKIKRALSEATSFIEGRTIHLDVRSESEVADVLQLIRIKLTPLKTK